MIRLTDHRPIREGVAAYTDATVLLEDSVVVVLWFNIPINSYDHVEMVIPINSYDHVEMVS